MNNIFGRHKYNFDRFTTSTWNRCLQLLPYLKKMNIKCRISDGRDTNTDIGILIRWQNQEAYDLVRRLRDKGVRTILDLCVNYFDATGVFEGGYGVTSHQVREVKRISAAVSAIIAGSDYIKRRAMEHNKNAIYLPESIDYNQFNEIKGKNDFFRNSLRAIWSGQSVKAAEVGDLYSTLKDRDIPLTIISNDKPRIPGPYNYLPWSYYTFPQNIVMGDFCISPRRIDNTYDLGHSHFKIGAFMAEGVPALAAPLPSYQEVIDDTGGGRICRSQSEWEETLDEILDNRKILWEWSQAAREGMKAYSTASVANDYRQFFEALLSS